MPATTPLEALPQPAESVSFLVGRVYYNYVVVLTALLAESGLDAYLAPGMGPVLFVLFDEDGLQLKEVIKRAGIAASTLSGMVRRMTAAGLVRRVDDEADGRGARLFLTDLGRSLEPRCRALSTRLEAVLCEGLAPQERSALVQLLNRVAGNLGTTLGRDWHFVAPQRTSR